MKNKIITLIMAVMVTLGATVSAIAVPKPYCMHDGYGFTYHMTYTKIGYKHWSISGTADVGAPTPWNITSGDYDKIANTFTITVTNPYPDGCYTASSYYTYSGGKTGGGGAFGGSWTNDCGGYGSWTGTITKGACTGPVANGNGSIIGPAAPHDTRPASITYKTSPYIPELESNFEVLQNTPNPFSTSTTISYSVYEDGNVTVEVYNTMGQLVATLLNANQTEGDYTLLWNGTDSKGNALANGAYLCRISGGGDSQTITMTLMK